MPLCAQVARLQPLVLLLAAAPLALLGWGLGAGVRYAAAASAAAGAEEGGEHAEVGVQGAAWCRTSSRRTCSLWVGGQTRCQLRVCRLLQAPQPG